MFEGVFRYRNNYLVNNVLDIKKNYYPGHLSILNPDLSIISSMAISGIVRDGWNMHSIEQTVTVNIFTF